MHETLLLVGEVFRINSTNAGVLFLRRVPFFMRFSPFSGGGRLPFKFNKHGCPPTGLRLSFRSLGGAWHLQRRAPRSNIRIEVLLSLVGCRFLNDSLAHSGPTFWTFWFPSLSHGPKRLTLYFRVLWASEIRHVGGFHPHNRCSFRGIRGHQTAFCPILPASTISPQDLPEDIREILACA